MLNFSTTWFQLNWYRLQCLPISIDMLNWSTVSSPFFHYISFIISTLQYWLCSLFVPVVSSVMFTRKWMGISWVRSSGMEVLDTSRHSWKVIVTVLSSSNFQVNLKSHKSIYENYFEENMEPRKYLNKSKRNWWKITYWKGS